MVNGREGVVLDRLRVCFDDERAVANAGVNVQVMYLATHDRGVIVTSDNAKALKAMGM